PAQIPGGDGSFAVTGYCDVPLFSNLRDRLVCRCVFRPTRHILLLSVAEMSPDDQLLVHARLQNDLRRDEFDPLDPRIFLSRTGGTRSNPVRENTIFERVRVEPGAAFMRNRSGRLQE